MKTLPVVAVLADFEPALDALALAANNVATGAPAVVAVLTEADIADAISRKLIADQELGNAVSRGQLLTNVIRALVQACGGTVTLTPSQLEEAQRLKAEFDPAESGALTIHTKSHGGLVLL